MVIPWAATLTYSAGDSAGNAAIPVTRTVNVVDLSSGGEDPGSSVEVELVSIVAGTFTMGSPADETGRDPMKGRRRRSRFRNRFGWGRRK